MIQQLLQLFSIQLLGHMLGDFYLQCERMCDSKRRNGFKSCALYVHTLLVFLSAWGVTATLSFWWAALLIAILHGLVDGVKSYIPKSGVLKKTLNSSISFYIDQVIHVSVIAFVVWLYVNHYWWQEWNWLTPYRNSMILAVVFCLWPANFFIGEFLRMIKIEKNNKEKKGSQEDIGEEHRKQTLDASRVIGSVERMLVFVFVWLGQYSAIGFLITAKSVMRFPEMGQGKNNAEYYLVGSLLSFGVSIMLVATIIALHSKGVL